MLVLGSRSPSKKRPARSGCKMRDQDLIRASIHTVKARVGFGALIPKMARNAPRELAKTVQDLLHDSSTSCACASPPKGQSGRQFTLSVGPKDRVRNPLLPGKPHRRGHEITTDVAADGHHHEVDRHLALVCSALVARSRPGSPELPVLPVLHGECPALVVAPLTPDLEVAQRQALQPKPKPSHESE